MTNEELLANYVYEPESGLLRRVGGLKPYPWRPTGTGGRYLATGFAGKSYYLHRLVFQYHHGYVPKMVDHIDGDTRNNRIENLRECTSAQNQYNRRKRYDSKGKFKGICFHESCPGKPWQAKIVFEKRSISLGYSATQEQAAAAYDAAITKFAGVFARTNGVTK